MAIADPTVVALAWLLEHPLKFIPLLGTTNLQHLRAQVINSGLIFARLAIIAACSDLCAQVTAFQHEGRMSNEQWWKIGGKGGLCALGDSQCNYAEYMPRE